MSYAQGIGTALPQVPTAAPERLQSVLTEAAKALNEALAALDGINSLLDGPLPTSGPVSQTEAPSGVAGWAFEVRRLAHLVVQGCIQHRERL